MIMRRLESFKDIKKKLINRYNEFKLVRIDFRDNGNGLRFHTSKRGKHPDYLLFIKSFSAFNSYYFKDRIKDFSFYTDPDQFALKEAKDYIERDGQDQTVKFITSCAGWIHPESCVTMSAFNIANNDDFRYDF